MKMFSKPTAIALLASLLITGSAYAGPQFLHRKTPPISEYIPPFDARRDAWLKKAVADYPLSTCVVSGAKLQDGGDRCATVNHVFRSAKHPDRLVRLCCKCCVADFKKDPFRYLEKINEAAEKPMAHPAEATR